MENGDLASLRYLSPSITMQDIYTREAVFKCLVTGWDETLVFYGSMCFEIKGSRIC